jgi:hypothetical protein
MCAGDVSPVVSRALVCEPIDYSDPAKNLSRLRRTLSFRKAKGMRARDVIVAACSLFISASSFMIVPSSSHSRSWRVFSSETSEDGGLDSSDKMLEVYLKHKSNPFFAIDSLQSSISALSVSVKQQGEQFKKAGEDQSKQIKDVQLQLRKQGEDQNKQIQDVQLHLRKQGEDQNKQIQDVQLQLRKQGEDVQLQLRKQGDDQNKQIQDVQLHLRKQGEDQNKQIQDVQLQLRKQGEDVQLQLRKQGEDQSKQIQDVQLQLRKQGENMQLLLRKQGEDIQFVKGALTVLTPIGVGVAGLVLKVAFFPG